eukprot:m.476198 g.476198  ORF g.476198 m.476198 type:complete len:311 (+) comp20466_c0_seq1:779-1711(+)
MRTAPRTCSTTLRRRPAAPLRCPCWTTIWSAAAFPPPRRPATAATTAAAATLPVTTCSATALAPKRRRRRLCFPSSVARQCLPAWQRTNNSSSNTTTRSFLCQKATRTRTRRWAASSTPTTRKATPATATTTRAATAKQCTSSSNNNNRHRHGNNGNGDPRHRSCRPTTSTYPASGPQRRRAAASARPQPPRRPARRVPRRHRTARQSAHATSGPPLCPSATRTTCRSACDARTSRRGLTFFVRLSPPLLPPPARTPAPFSRPPLTTSWNCSARNVSSCRQKQRLLPRISAFSSALNAARAKCVLVCVLV